MSDQPTLSRLLGGLHEVLATQLGVARAIINHPGTKGDVSESRWLELFRDHLPARYQANKAFVIDSHGKQSDQIDVVIHDRQYSPFMVHFENAIYVPAESVYAVFEVKQNMDAGQVEYASKKIASVRALYRTSIPIPSADREYAPKPLHHIVGGLLSLESDWNPAFGDAFRRALLGVSADGRLDIGCAVRQGAYEVDYSTAAPVLRPYYTDRSLAFFVLRLIARLQCMATVPCLDVMAYAAAIETSAQPR